jgi:hypothetical protein
MNGYPDGTFRPENTITRGEMADIIAKWLRLTEGGQTPLKDISGHWAQGSIEKVYKSGIMQGYPDGTFKEKQGWDITVVRIGDQFIQVGLGGEICCPIGLRIKDELRGNMVMVSGYTNANSGYFPSQTQIAAGGYEVFSNLHYKPYTPEAEDILVYGVMQTVKELASSSSRS